MFSHCRKDAESEKYKNERNLWLISAYTFLPVRYILLQTELFN